MSDAVPPFTARHRNAFPTGNAIRIARCRERKQQGKVYLEFELDPWLVSGLVVSGWLGCSDRYDRAAVAVAFRNFISVAFPNGRPLAPPAVIATRLGITPRSC
jgi:hypothetical protein